MMIRWLGQYGLTLVLCCAVVMVSGNIATAQLAEMTGQVIDPPFAVQFGQKFQEIHILGDIYYVDGDLVTNTLVGLKETVQTFSDALQYTTRQLLDYISSF